MMALTAPVSRTTIFTRDAERALGFYRDLLEMEVWIDTLIPNPGASDILGQPCESMRIIVLRADDTTIGNIGLAEVHGANPPLEDPVPATNVRFGEPCMVAAGVHVISPPTKLELPLPEEVWEMFLRDPDGTMINLSHHGPW